jgi:hypothetical protein
MKTYEEVDYIQHNLPRQHMKESAQLHALAALPWGRSPVTYWIGDWVGPKASLDCGIEKFLRPIGI